MRGRPQALPVAPCLSAVPLVAVAVLLAASLSRSCSPVASRLRDVYLRHGRDRLRVRSSTRLSISSSAPAPVTIDAAARPALARRAFPPRRARRLLPRRRQSRRRRREPLSALGYGRHEHAPQRVLPFFPAFLAGMNLVVLADDAFTFLLSWEFMSLTSWALVMAHHRDERQRARRLRLSGDGELRHALPAARLRPAGRARRRLRLRRDPRRRRHAPAHRRARARRWCCSAPARRPASCRCMSGCRSPIRPRRATSRR